MMRNHLRRQYHLLGSSSPVVTYYCQCVQAVCCTAKCNFDRRRGILPTSAEEKQHQDRTGNRSTAHPARMAMELLQKPEEGRS